MKTVKCVLVLMILLGIAAGCFGADKPAEEQKTDEEIVVEGNNEFALELYAKLRVQQGNLFFSPYSISTALAMTWAGARAETEKQMARVLHFTLPQERLHKAFCGLQTRLNAPDKGRSYELNVANALWGQKGEGFLEEFLGLVKTNYGGGLNEVDFVQAAEAARQTINAWVEKETNGKIKDLIGKSVLDRMTRLVLTNAIYFKGNWARQFEKDRTKDGPFTLLSGGKVDVPMMNQTAEFNYMEAEDLQGLELPYVDDELSMIILLPREVDGLGELEKTLTAERLSQWLAGLHKRKVIVSVPKFRMTSKFGLADVLKSMGMTDAFCGVADFSGMNGKRDLFISAVIHKAYVDVNEEGTEAAAATGVVMRLTSARPEEPVVFNADHPFVFLIRDNKSGSILFIGRVMNPKVDES